MTRLIRSDKRVGGCFFTRTRGHLAISTDREPVVTLHAAMSGGRVTCTHPCGREEVVTSITDDAALARWACRLAAEYGQGVRLEVAL